MGADLLYDLAGDPYRDTYDDNVTLFRHSWYIQPCFSSRHMNFIPFALEKIGKPLPDTAGAADDSYLYALHLKIPSSKKGEHPPFPLMLLM